MKRILCIAFVLFASVGIYAQEKTIGQTEFDKVYKNSIRWQAGKSYREIRTQQSTIEVLPQTNTLTSSKVALSPVNNITKSTTEFLPAVGFHSTYEFNSPSLNSKKERIRVSGKTYTREGNEKWIEEIPIVKPKHESMTKTIDIQIEYKYLGSETFNNQNTAVYAKIEKSKLINLKNNSESFSTSINKHWYGEDGNLLKTESKREIRNGKTVGSFNSTTLYQLDPNIKIEVPSLS